MIKKSKEILQDRQLLPVSLKKKQNNNNNNKTSNEPMCVANNDLWLPNMVSQLTRDKQTENQSKKQLRGNC